MEKGRKQYSVNRGRVYFGGGGRLNYITLIKK